MEPMSNLSQDTKTTFDKDVSLFTMVGQDQARKLLLTWINSYYVNHSENKDSRIGSVLLIGRTATTLARALSNSFGNTSFHFVEGIYLSNGIGYDEYFMEGDSLTTCFIHQAEKCKQWLLPEFHRILHEGILRQPEKIGYSQEQFHPVDKLIIFSAYDDKSMDTHLVDSMDVVCRLKKYSAEEVQRILKQRIQYLNLQTEKSVFETITNIAQGDVKLAIKILLWTDRCSKADGELVIKVKHLNSVLHLLG
jgi:hypothetical protein